MPLPKTPALTTDCVVFDPQDRVLLVRRASPPSAGAYALPGGFVEIGETVEAACRRELQEETGVAVDALTLVGVYSDPSRDPRAHTVTVAYAARLPEAPAPRAGSDAAGAEWIADWRQIELAFDHARLIADAAETIRRLRRD